MCRFTLERLSDQRVLHDRVRDVDTARDRQADQPDLDREDANEFVSKRSAFGRANVVHDR